MLDYGSDLIKNSCTEWLYTH